MKKNAPIKKQKNTLKPNLFKDIKSLIEKTDGSKFRQTAKRPPKTGFIIDKASNMLGYQPCSFKEGIAILAEQIK